MYMYLSYVNRMYNFYQRYRISNLWILSISFYYISIKVKICSELIIKYLETILENKIVYIKNVSKLINIIRIWKAGLSDIRIYAEKN